MNRKEHFGSFPDLNLPPVELRINRGNGVLRVFDSIRKKYVALTPEEFVRQHFVKYLVSELHYPVSLMANEIGIEYNGMRRRCDTVVFNPDGTPLLIVEYKAPSVNITQNVFDQIVRYNSVLHAGYLIVTNGMSHFCCVIDYSNNTYNFIPSIPDYRDMKTNISLN